jgi:hypothetical protein
VRPILTCRGVGWGCESRARKREGETRAGESSDLGVAGFEGSAGLVKKIIKKGTCDLGLSPMVLIANWVPRGQDGFSVPDMGGISRKRFLSVCVDEIKVAGAGPELNGEAGSDSIWVMAASIGQKEEKRLDRTVT